jgi:hypothetical protein
MNRFALLALMFAYSGCIISDCAPVVGNDCEATEDCFDSADARPNVCVPVDPEDSSGDLICAPAIVLAETACGDEEECVQAGFPIDVECSDGFCTCENLGIDCDEVGGDFAARTCGCSGDFGLKDEGEPCETSGECITPSCSGGVCSFECLSDDECRTFNCDEASSTCV